MQLNDNSNNRHLLIENKNDHRELKHVSTHPDVFDPSFKRRGDEDEEEDEFLDEEIDNTDYSPWYFTYVNSTNLTADPWRTATGDIRVCNIGQVPRPTRDMYCMENRLNKPRIFLQTGSWIESIIIAWIAQLLLQEQVQVPVDLTYMADSSHTFFPTQKVYNQPGLLKFKFDKSGKRIYEETDIMNPLKYSWKGLYNSYIDMLCSIESKQDIFENTMELKDHPLCEILDGRMVSICKPCMHVMLDIWDGQEENLEQAFRSKEIEYGGELGIVEQQGWYTQESILKKNPELATYRGLLSSNKTEKVYMRPLAFGEFCWLRKNGDIPDIEIPYKDPQSGLFREDGEKYIESFCRMFYLYHEWVDPYLCAFDPYKYPKIPEYNICKKYQVVLDDMWKYAPFVAADMDVYSLTPASPKIMRGRVRLFEGYFRKIERTRLPNAYPLNEIDTWSPPCESKAYSNVTRKVEYGGFLLHNGCPKSGDVDTTYWGKKVTIGTSSIGEPSGSQWRYDLLDMVDHGFKEIHPSGAAGDGMGNVPLIVKRKIPLSVTPLDVGDRIIEIWEMTNRQRTNNFTTKWRDVGNLMYLSRPHPIFERYKYNVSGYSPLFEEVRNNIYRPKGEEWKLSRISLPPWNTECEKNRRAKLNLCQFNASKTKVDVGEYLKNTNVDVNTLKETAMCDYKSHKVYKVFVSKLKDYNREAWYFLKKFTITNDDIESIMGNVYYNPEYINKEKDIPKRRRQAVVDWIQKNKHRWENWIPESAKTRRCRGEINPTITDTGAYIKGKECSGHGICMPDKWVQYSGVCKCDRGWTGLVTIDGILPKLDDCSKLDVGTFINLKFADLFALRMNFIISGMLLLIIILGTVTYILRDTPIWDKHGSAHSLLVCGGTFFLLLNFYSWVEQPTIAHCILRPSLVGLGCTMLFGVHVSKMHYILGVISNPRVTQDALVNVNSKYIVFEVFKHCIVQLVMILLHLIWMPETVVIRVDGRIWEKYMDCEYSSWGILANYTMFFHVCLILISSIDCAIRLKLWKKYEFRHYLYLKEELFMELNVVVNAVFVGLAVPYFFMNQSPNEQEKLYAITVILSSMGGPSIFLNYFPKFIIALCKREWNQMRGRYDTNDTPVQVLVKQTKELATNLEDVEREKVFLQEIIREESLKFEKKEANLTEQTAILFESLRSNIPSLNRFCKGLKLLEYEELFEQNELNVKKLMHLRGNFDVLNKNTEFPIKMKRGHQRKMQQALYDLNRVYTYHEKFYNRNIKPEEFKKQQEEMQKELKRILKEEEEERRAELKELGLWEDIHYILKFEIVMANGIKKADTFGKSDAYCVVLLDQEKADKTNTINNSLDPEWYQTFQIRIPEEIYEKEEDFSLRFEIFDYDSIGADDFLGMHEFNHHEFIHDFIEQDRNTVKEYNLMEKNGNKGKGKLSIKFISIKKFGDDTRIPNPPEETDEDEESEYDEDGIEEYEDGDEIIDGNDNGSNETPSPPPSQGNGSEDYYSNDNSGSIDEDEDLEGDIEVISTET